MPQIHLKQLATRADRMQRTQRFKETGNSRDIY